MTSLVHSFVLLRAFCPLLMGTIFHHKIQNDQDCFLKRRVNVVIVWLLRTMITTNVMYHLLFSCRTVLRDPALIRSAVIFFLITT